MFPLIFQNLCVLKISFVQHFSRTTLYFERCVWHMCKNISERNIYVSSKFSCVRSSHGLCACTQVHSLEGALLLMHFLSETSSSYANSGLRYCRIMAFGIILMRMCFSKFSNILLNLKTKKCNLRLVFVQMGLFWACIVRALQIQLIILTTWQIIVVNLINDYYNACKQWTGKWFGYLLLQHYFIFRRIYC